MAIGQININKKAIISFLIFIVILTKDYLVSYLHIIPERSPLNRSINWFLILPLSILGVIFSIQIFRSKFLERKYEKKSVIDLSFILSLPCLLYVLYWVLIAIIGSFN